MKMPFSKNDHIKVVSIVAQGLQISGMLNRYLELGIRSGSCFNRVAPLAKEAYAVDIDDCYKKIKENKNLVWYHGRTTDFLKEHNKDKKFDLVFIDADHKHESSLSDFNNVFSLVNENGLILLHDVYPPSKEFLSPKYCSDTYKTSICIRRDFSDVCEIVTLPFYYGLAIVRKIPLGKQLLWM
jgi:hypothetical protein